MLSGSKKKSALVMISTRDTHDSALAFAVTALLI
jgi:hypothetical protein